MFKLLAASDFKRLDKVVPWAESQMGQANREPLPAPNNNKALYPCIGFLQQSIYGGGYGSMLLAYRTEILNTTQIDIVGTNYVESSSFKLRLSGKRLDQVDPPPQVLFTTSPILVNSTAADIRTALAIAAGSVSLPIKRTDFVVDLGNPMSVPEAAPPYLPEIDDSAEPPDAYVGSWIIRLEGALLRLYSELTFTVVTDNQAFMRGLSTIVYRPTVMVPGSTTRLVFDPVNRPLDYPWRIGSLCVALPFVGMGYGIVMSDFRDQTISLPTAEPQETP